MDDWWLGNWGFRFRKTFSLTSGGFLATYTTYYQTAGRQWWEDREKQAGKLWFFFHYFDGPCFCFFWRKKYIVLLYIVSSYEFFNYAPIKLLSGSFAGINIFLLWRMLILLYSRYNQFIILIPKRPLYLLNLILWPLAAPPRLQGSFFASGIPTAQRQNLRSVFVSQMQKYRKKYTSSLKFCWKGHFCFWMKIKKQSLLSGKNQFCRPKVRVTSVHRIFYLPLVFFPEIRKRQFCL